MNDVDLGYISGVFDGEGCVAIVKMRRPPYKEISYNLMISITNSDPDLIEWLHERLGGHVGVMGRHKGRGKLVKRWYESGRDAGAVLEMLLPYLKVKRKQALLALEYLKLGRGWERSARADFHEHMRFLNKGSEEQNAERPQVSHNNLRFDFS